MEVVVIVEHNSSHLDSDSAAVPLDPAYGDLLSFSFRAHLRGLTAFDRPSWARVRCCAALVRSWLTGICQVQACVRPFSN
jgi:hypothetical protein